MADGAPASRGLRDKSSCSATVREPPSPAITMHAEPTSGDKSQNSDGCEELEAANTITTRNVSGEVTENQSSNASTNHAFNNSKGNALLSAANAKMSHAEPASQTSPNHQKRYNIKSSSFNGVTIQQLQMKRRENQAVADRQKLLRNQNGSMPLAKSVSEEEGERGPATIPQATSLPVVRAATKLELLRLSQRYAPSVAFRKARSHTGVPSQSTGPQRYIVDRRGSEHEHGHSQTFPLKLILRGMSAGNTNASHATTVVTPDEKQIGKMQNHPATESSDGHYLLHLEHLARDNSRQRSTNAAEEAFGDIIDDEVSFSHESSSSSYASPTPHLQAASACDSNAGNDDDIVCSEQILKSDEDADTNYFTCLCKAHTLISDREAKGLSGTIAGTELEHATKDENSDCSVLQNARLQKIAICTMHALTILIIALACSWVEFLQDKMMIRFRSSLYWMLSPAKFIGQTITDWIDATRASYVNFSSWSNYCDPRKFLRQLDLQTPTYVLVRTKHVSVVVWHGLHTLCSNRMRDIDTTSLLIETWFRVVKLQCDCQLFVYDIIKRLREFGEATSMAWNTTFTNMMSSWQDDVFTQSPPQTDVDKQINLRKSKSTIPIKFPSDIAITFVNSTRNQTLPLDINPLETTTTTEVCLKSTKKFWKSTIGPSFPPRRDRYSHSTASFRYVQNSLPTISPDFADADVLFLYGHHHRPVANNNDVPSSFHFQSYEVLPYKYRNLHLNSLPYSVQTVVTSKEAAIKHYAESFPTFSIDDHARDDKDFFESVNLMDMASEITKRLIPKRKHSEKQQKHDKDGR